MKLLVTGAAGFIGSHLSERLKSLGHDVVGLDCFAPYYSVELKELNASDLRKKGVEILKLDLAKDGLSKAVKDVEVIYHLAGQPGISAVTPFEDYLKNNIVATYRLLESAKEQKSLKMFVNISTSSVYGIFATDTENVAPKPTSYYGVTKLAAEQLVLSYFRDGGLPSCSMRLFSVYGERERPEKLYPKLIDAILNNKEFPYYAGTEKHLRSYTYVGDILDGLVSVLNRTDACLGEIFNLGIESAISTDEGIRIVERIIGKKAKKVVKPHMPGNQTKTVANIAKARKVLSYNPTTPPEEGLKKEVKWFKEEVWKKINLYP